MNLVVKDKMQREIMAVQNAFLFADIKQETKVYTRDEIDFETIIEQNYEFLVRGPLETNFDYKQPIPYGIVLNNKNEIFVYKRGGAGSNAGESRLHDKIAIGVGGHIEREDEASTSLLRDALIREVEEEIGIQETDIAEVFPIGYVNYEEDEVNQVHLGIGYIVKLSGGEISMTDGELAKGEFKTLSELKAMIASGDYDVEFWTQMLTPEIEKYIA
jgi:predicted NUDIX family phosphoesterase